jgi:glycosyltransferase involved in cell wall biosynthesis
MTNISMSNNPRPFLSVVFPTMNRVDYLRKTLASLRRELDGKYRYEIVVVDGRSTDGTRELLDTHDTIRTIDEETPRGCCYAFDLGLRAARGEWVCWLNDDVEITQGAMDKMITFMTNPANTNVGMGAFLNSRDRSTPHEFVIRGIWDYPVIYADFGFLRRELLHELDFLDLSFRKFGWDPDLALRIWERGLRIAPCEGANIVHYFAEDAARASSQKDLERDTAWLLAKWEDKRKEGKFYTVYEDENYRQQVMRLVTGWPRINLCLHYNMMGGLVDTATEVYLNSPDKAGPYYYRFGLELLRKHCFEEALLVFETLASNTPENDSMHVWYRYKTAESLLRLGQNARAHAIFAETARQGHVMSRLRVVPENAPLAVALGSWSKDSSDRIKIPLNIQDPTEWDYYFCLRPADDILLVLSGSELGLDCRLLARMLDSALAHEGLITVRPYGETCSARHFVNVLATELVERDFSVTSEVNSLTARKAHIPNRKS